MFSSPSIEHCEAGSRSRGVDRSLLSINGGTVLEYDESHMAGSDHQRSWLGDALKCTRKRASQNAKSWDVFDQACKPAKVFRAGLFARVSTNEQQTLAMQNRALREYAAHAAGRLPCKCVR
jgi:hypothetical protein